jgi:hypothetical protein
MSENPNYHRPASEGGDSLPIHWLFRELRSRWLAKATKNNPRRSRDLAERFGTSPQAIAQWASGTDPSKRAPWWVLLSLSEELRLEIRLSATEVSLVQRRRSK